MGTRILQRLNSSLTNSQNRNFINFFLRVSGKSDGVEQAVAVVAGMELATTEQKNGEGQV
jgi:hypothetical protein